MSKNSLYNRLRDELWFKAREWFEGNDAIFRRSEENDDYSQLISELSSIKYDINSTGKLIVESKKSLKSRGLKSPDMADAFVLTFAIDVNSSFPSQWSDEIEYDFDWVV